MNGFPSSAAVVILSLTLTLSLAISLTAAAAFGWWGRTRSGIILIVGWTMVGAILFGMSFSIMFMLPFL